MTVKRDGAESESLTFCDVNQGRSRRIKGKESTGDLTDVVVKALVTHLVVVYRVHTAQLEASWVGFHNTVSHRSPVVSLGSQLISVTPFFSRSMDELRGCEALATCV